MKSPGKQKREIVVKAINPPTEINLTPEMASLIIDLLFNQLKGQTSK